VVESSAPASARVPRLVVLADLIEQASLDGRPFAELIEELDVETARRERSEPRRASATTEPLARWRRVVEQVRLDEHRGHMRSVTGLAREARRLMVQLERVSSSTAN